MNKLIQMLNHQAKLHYDQGAFGLSELFKNATNEILALHEENEKLKDFVQLVGAMGYPFETSNSGETHKELCRKYTEIVDGFKELSND